MNRGFSKLGLAFLQQNRENEAGAEFRRAIAIDAQFRPAREALGCRRRLAEVEFDYGFLVLLLDRKLHRVGISLPDHHAHRPGARK